MAKSRLSGVGMAGVASAVPEQTEGVADVARQFGRALADRIAESTGVSRRHIAPAGLCTSDLCFAAARQLLTELDWSPDSIEGLIFVSQTPDYILPPTSAVLQARLGLPTSCAAFDVGLGCSGYIYGLWLGAQMIASGSVTRVLVLAGDTTSRFMSPQDHSVTPLFGDAATATALEADPDAAPVVFSMGTDGRGQRHAIIPAGGFRSPRSPQTAQLREFEGGNFRSDEHLTMNGAGVLAFAMQHVPRLVRETLEAAEWSVEMMDALVMHQANRAILDFLVKRIKLPPEKVVFAMEGFGNTSSASVPLAMTHALRERLSNPARLLLASFGNGFSWGAAAIHTRRVCMPALIRVPSALAAATP